MHIPGHLIERPIEISAAVISAGSLTVLVLKILRKKMAVNFKHAALSLSLVFLLQMLNFPVMNGTSGHFLGTVFILYFLGIEAGLIGMSLLLAVQTLVFGDGGLSALGINILNMVLFAALPYFFFQKSRLTGFMKYFAAGWLSVVLASVAAGFQMGFSSETFSLQPLISMAGIHSLIGLAEGLFTGWLLTAAVSEPVHKDAAGDFHFKWLTGLLLFLCLLMLLPFASSLPDGLETVAAQYGLLKPSLPQFSAPFNNYEVFGYTGVISQLIAFISGSSLIALLYGMFSMVVSRKRKNQFK